MSNPYTLVFGQPPFEVVERTAQAERIVSDFCQERPSNYLNLVTGIRGCGKTVFITQIAHRLREKPEWIVIDLNAQRDLLDSLAAKLASHQVLSQWFQEAEINLQAFGVNVGLKRSTAANDIEDVLIRMLRSIQKHRLRVLVTIDEATNSREIRAFASAYQIFIREGLPVFLLMTGLYHQIERLRNAEGMTFLERAPRTVLSPLNFIPMVRKYIETLRITEEKATRLAKATKGYAFAFQTIGYFCWEYPDNEAEAMTRARDYLSEFAYQKIWSELSKNDREVVLAVQKVPSGEIAGIRSILGWTSNQFNPYRDRLLKAGVLMSPQSGYVTLALPWFGEVAAEFEEINNA